MARMNRTVKLVLAVAFGWVVTLAATYGVGFTVAKNRSGAYAYPADQIARLSIEAEERALARLKRPQITLTGYIIDSMSLDNQHQCHLRRNTEITEGTKAFRLAENGEGASWPAYRSWDGSYVCYTDGRWWETEPIKSFL